MEPTLWSIICLGFLCGLNVALGVAPKGHPKETKTASIEKQLIRKLLDRYERFGVVGRPVNDSRIRVVVRYGLQLFQILDLDENKQILRTNCWSLYTWEDALLRWNESEFGNIKTVRIFPSQIWTPDIKLYNFADERLKEHREARVVIYSDGSTLWIPQALFKSTCEVEITYFPFDTQICMLEFGSWTYDRTQMDITWWIPDSEPTAPMPYLDFSDYVPSNEWRTDGELERKLHHTNRTKQIRSVKKYRRRNETIGGVFMIKEYPVLRYLVRLRRNPTFYIFMLIIPCILLSSLTSVVFWLPPESPAKMMLGMNIFVAFFVLLLLLAESTPSAVKNFPIIGVFFCLNMVMITLSTFLATAVIHFYFRGDRNGVVPAILRRVVIEGIGRLVCMHHRVKLLNQKKLSHFNSSQKNSLEKARRKQLAYASEQTKFLPTDLTFGQNGQSGFYPGIGQFPPGTRPMGYPLQHGDQFVGGMHPMAPRGGRRPLPTPQAYYNSYGLPGFAAPPTSPFSQNPRTSMREISGFGSQPVLKDSNTHEGIANAVDQSGMVGPSAKLERDVIEIKRWIKSIVSRQKEIQRKNFISMEWRLLALILDRFFFFLYVTTIIVGMIACIPRTTEPEVPDAFTNSEE
ncbi:unnamed protein product [Calicophoron daubneyi]|uniref:Uncharacterized protein n=1 Tax=Calicophoron daubneyi TaxID=300641 RepID=A0AAV2TK16_CALDB